MSDSFATVRCMQSEQVRQRTRERKRIQRDEKRRSRERLPVEIDVSVEWRREVMPEEEAPIRARDELDILVPRRVAVLFAAAMRVARKEAGKPLSPGECLVRIARHYIDRWEPVLRGTGAGSARPSSRGC
jgi:hypothetical protein